MAIISAHNPLFRTDISVPKKKWRLWILLVTSTHSPEKAMEPHASTLAWKIPWTEEPDRLQSMGSVRVGHD